MKNRIGPQSIRRDVPHTSVSNPTATPTASAASGALLVDVDFGGLMAARRADHNAHCTCCRELTAASDAAAAENGASIQRRDRRQLDLPFSRHTRAVSV